MISIDFAIDQISRLGGMYRFPDKYPAAVMDLAKALAHFPEVTEEMAISVIDAIKDTATSETACPMPAEIRGMVNDKLPPWNPDPACTLCNGEGFPRILKNGEYYSGDKCPCWARRPAPVYPRNEAVREELQGEISRAAQGKRV